MLSAEESTYHSIPILYPNCVLPLPSLLDTRDYHTLAITICGEGENLAPQDGAVMKDGQSQVLIRFEARLGDNRSDVLDRYVTRIDSKGASWFRYPVHFFDDTHQRHIAKVVR